MRAKFCLLVGAIVAGLTAAAPAQFNLNTWMNFEGGTLPADVSLMHNAKPQNTRVVEYAALGKPAIIEGRASAEVGRYGLEMKTDAASRFLCVMAASTLQRAKLDETGRALFQADIYVDGQSDLGHTMAVVGLGVDPAAKPKAGSHFWKLYRFGVLGADKAFFSFTDGSPAPKIYLHEKLSAIAPAASQGWHRFQFVVEGTKSISCYVDGVRTSYSPIAEATFQTLQPGILVGAPANAPMTVYVDNLSIQWTMDPATPMPASPWMDQQEVEQAAGRLLWETDYAAAAAKSKESGKPLLVLFYLPGNAAFQELTNNILQNSEEAQSILQPYVPVRVDVNQLSGASLSRQFSIRRVPTLLAIGADGKDHGRVEMLQGERWSSLRPKMQAAFKEPGGSTP